MEINSVFKAFRRGFTKGNVNSIIPKLYIKTLINLFYLIILILAQIEDLKLATLPSGLSYFCTLNKYGIVIVFAVEKIIKSVAAEKKRKRILTETFIEQEKQDEKDREETRRLMREVKELFKQRRAEKKLARQKRKQAKENSKGKNKK